MRNKVKANEDKLMWESFNEASHEPEMDSAEDYQQYLAGKEDAMTSRPVLSDPFKQMMEALSRTATQGGDITIKSFDKESKTIVLSTGGEKSIIVQVVGHEGDHDIPVSLRPTSGGPRDEPGMGPEYRVRSDEPEPFGYGRD